MEAPLSGSKEIYQKVKPTTVARDTPVYYCGGCRTEWILPKKDEVPVSSIKCDWCNQRALLVVPK